MGSACSNFFITITEKLNIQQIQGGDATSFQKHSFPGIFPSMKIIPITEAEIVSTFPKRTTGSVELAEDRTLWYSHQQNQYYLLMTLVS